MEIAIRFFPRLDEFQNNSRIELEDDAKVKSVIDYVIEKYNLEESFYGSEDPRFVYRTMLNGRDIKNLQGNDSPLREGDMISFLLPVAGG